MSTHTAGKFGVYLALLIGQDLSLSVIDAVGCMEAQS